MASRYPISTIGEVCDVGDGAHAKVERRNSGILYLTSKNIGSGRLNLDKVDYISEDDYERLFAKQSKATRRPMPGDVLIGIIGTFGNAYRYRKTDRFGISSSVAILRPDQSLLHPDYLYYVTTSDSFKNAHLAIKGGSAQGYTNIPTVRTLPIPLPPLMIQRRIARILGALDDKIEVNRCINRTLEEMAQTLYKHWFVDFGPFQAGGFVDSELGVVPAGWEVTTLGNLVDIATTTTNPQDYPDEIFNHYSIPALGEGLLPVQERGAEVKSNKYLITSDRILLSKLNPRFYRIWAVYQRDDYRSFSSTEFINYVAKQPNTWAFLNCLLRSPGFIAEFRSRATGTTTSRQRVKPKETLSFRCPHPPKEVLGRFESIVSPYFRLIQDNAEQNRALAQTRDYLLPKLLSGEVEVPAAVAVVEGRPMGPEVAGYVQPALF